MTHVKHARYACKYIVIMKSYIITLVLNDTASHFPHILAQCPATAEQTWYETHWQSFLPHDAHIEITEQTQSNINN